MVRQFVTYALTGVVVALTLSADPAWAKNEERGKDFAPGQTQRFSIPEFDPATVGAISMVLVGGGVILARRRKR